MKSVAIVVLGASLGLAPRLSADVKGFVRHVSPTGHNYLNCVQFPVLAPGEIVGIWVHGIRRDFDYTKPIIAKETPLPRSLDGISVTIPDLAGGRLYAPILAVRKEPACNWGVWPPKPDCGYLIVIIVQIPFEMRGEGIPYGLSFSIYDGDELVAVHRFTPADAQIHIVTSGADVIQVFNPQLQANWLYPIVRHQDGTLVNGSSPAKPGEILSLWAVGLGVTTLKDLPKTGEPAEPGYEFRRGYIGIDYQWGSRLPPRKVTRLKDGSFPSEGLLWAGLLPGQVGIYQINFRVPETIPEDLPPCSGLDWNLTVSIGSPGYALRPIGSGLVDTFDGAGICVEAPAKTGGQ